MKKRIICLVLAIFMILALSSCVIDQKYDYDMTKYVQLPTIAGKEIEVKLDMVQATIDSAIIEAATDKYAALEGDDVKMIISIKELYWLDDEKTHDTDEVTDENGIIIKPVNILYTTDDATTSTVESILINNLGAGNFHSEIEKKFIKKKLGQEHTDTYTLPEDLTPLKAMLTEEQYEKIAPFAGKDCYITYKFVSRPVREGDIVSVTYKGYYTDDAGNIKLDADGNKEEFDGGSGTSTVYIGSQTFIKDFEKGLIGLSVGTEGEFKATFPEDYGVEDLNGKTVIFTATVKEIYITPTYDLDFVKKTYGDQYTSVEEFEEELIKTYASQEILNYLVTNTTVLDYPKSEYKLIKRQLDEMDVEFALQYGMEFDEYIKTYLGFDSREAYIKYTMQMEMAYYAYAQSIGMTPTEGDIATARASLISTYKEQYLSSYDDITDAEALELATAFVDEELEESDIYQEALYTIVGEHIETQYVIKKVAKTYNSVTTGGSLFDAEDAE